ncbi:16S rRNA (uracil(1498)-N(3))-methyltransferase [Qipengyuania sediminis]|uniref:16S rRNA (uracil(1498)-N(3))-methyltransferase n=1 Tax=Qipengyuania sediminis TaxID=1532023 RepID=UPI00105A20CB|nr:16S rRNA (uracil(1498)-N(3))-methyltransferase [Qipengyuania sediminis]
MPATPAWPPRSAPRLFVASLLAKGAEVRIEGTQAHYLATVMRAQAGSAVVLCDDRTGEWAARVVEAGRRGVTLAVAERLRPREAVPDLWLCPALLKKDRFDLVLEKATELGVAAIRPALTRRAVATKLNPERARAIVTEAAEQCARTALPALAEPVPLERLLRDWPGERTLFFADEMGGTAAVSAFAGQTKAALLIGPEGGFDDAERAAIRAVASARPISLGPRILRGETAAVAATALWMAAAGDWGTVP